MNIRPLNVLSLLILVATLLAGCAVGPYADMQHQVPLEQLKPSLHQLGDWNDILHDAAGAGRIDVAEYALANGADINALRNWGCTALHRAAMRDQREMIIYLVNHGADLNKRDSGLMVGLDFSSPKRTPLEFAIAWHADPKTIELLTQLTAERSDWASAQKLNTAAAYQSFLDSHPKSAFADQAGAHLKEIQDKEAAVKKAEEERQRRMAERESKLPATVRRDKYMLSLVQLLKEQRFAEAIPYCEKLSQLPLKTDPSLDYYYGECLMRTGQPMKALEKFYDYVNNQGRNAPLYSKALGMINEIEAGQ